MSFHEIVYRIKVSLSKLFYKFGLFFSSSAKKLDPTSFMVEEYSMKPLRDNDLLFGDNNPEQVNRPSIKKKRCPRWLKKVLVVLSILIGALVLFEAGSIVYTEVLYPKKTEKEHKAIVQAAYSDISLADSVARVLFKYEQKSGGWPKGHHSKFYDFIRDEYGFCRFDHIKQGIDLLIFAAEKGDPSAQFTLGCYYGGADYRSGAEENGWGTSTMDGKDINNVRSAYWYLKSAEQGNGTAMNNLAMCYQRGEGVEKDLRKYYEWIKKSAECGNRYGLMNLGDIYRDGLKVEVGSHKEYSGYHYDFDYEGAHKIKEYRTVTDYETLITPDIQKAKMYWQQSADKGCKQALERLEKIY